MLLQSQAAAGGLHDHPGRPGQRPVLRRPVVQHDQADRPAVRRQRRVRHRRLRPPGEPGRLPQLGLQDATASGTRRTTRTRHSTRRSRNSSPRSASTPRRRRARRSRQIMHRRHADRDPVLLQLPVRQLEEVHRRVHLRARSDVPVGRFHRLVTSHGSVRWPGALVPRPTSQDGDVARWPATSRAGSCWRSSHCGCWSRSCSRSPTCCRATSDGRSSGRSPRRRASTPSTSGSAPTGRCSIRYAESDRGHRHPRLR